MAFRYLIRRWLETKARRNLRETMAHTVRDQLGRAARPAAAEQSAVEPRTCDVGVVFALAIEAGGLEDLVTDVTRIRGHGFLAQRGRLKKRNVTVIRSGPGGDAAARATEALISGHRPGWIISAGFAGGLNSALKRHDVVMADSLADLAGNRLAIDLKADPVTLAQTPGVHVGRLLSADRIIRLPDEKRSLGQSHEALAVDMESFAVAEVCRRRQVRFLAVRVISDAVDEQLPPDVGRLMEQETHAARLGAALGAIWQRPGSLKDMYRLKENALVASDRLARFLASIVEQLAPPAPPPE